ncbi:MAG: adenosylcobinamide-GDP ribazoletransferase [Oscillospiraceae bacterium]|nr:adenosylcobinamide-GDP ribazoletransferase [Oscillospiraceae bacterium]
MTRYFKGLYMSLGMFCAIPLPFNLWDDKCMNLMLPCFPLVGALIGAIWWGAAKLLVFAGAHIALCSAALAALPFFLTGFLHLDGYMDTSDAVLSRRPLEDKLRILKDPHTGAFSVIMIAVLFVFQFAAVYAAVDNGKYFLPLIFIAVISRCASSLSVLWLKPMPQSGYANMFRQNTKTAHKIFLILILACALALSLLSAGVWGLIVSVSVIFGYAGAFLYAYTDLKGVSGDVAGFALVIGELCGLVALALIGG